MKILILGASGLIGHTLLRELSCLFDVWGTLHKLKAAYATDFFDRYKIIDNIDVRQTDLVESTIRSVAPDVVLNCAGITKRKINEKNLAEAIEVNSCFPHRLAELSLHLNFRLIHFSTDCVFNGKEGNYTENSLTTAEDVYGRTKALGEVLHCQNCLTLRSSFIGQELFDKTELLDWFLKQKGKKINGFTKTLYSGVSTVFMAKVVTRLIIDFPLLNGLYQLAPEKPVSKFDLLSIAKEKFGVDVEIVPDYNHIHTPTLNAVKLRSETGIVVPSWEEMMSGLAQKAKDYK